MRGGAGSAFQQNVLFAFGGGDPRITLALLDGPVDRTHDCFRGALLTPLEGVGDGDASATERGTHAASVIFGQPCSSVEGIAPLCRGLVVPIFRNRHRFCLQRDLALAIQAALDSGAQAIQIGGGRFELSAAPDPLLAGMLRDCAARGVLIVSARGREGCAPLGADDAPVLSVGAAGGTRLPHRMDRNSARRIVAGIAIPAKGVFGAALQGGVARHGGANCAASLVTGIVGLLLAQQIRRGAVPDPMAIREALMQASAQRDRRDWRSGQRLLAGRAHIERALECMALGIARSPAFPFDLVRP